MIREIEKIVVTIIVLVSVLGLGACDSSIEPIVNKGKEYSIYGPLDIQKNTNHIRVHDTNDLLRADATAELDVKMIFTNLTTGESNLLSKKVIFHEGVYSHNYEVESDINFDTRYKIEIEDADGFKDSLISVTTREASTTVPTDSVYCDEYFQVEFTQIALDEGERLEIEAGMKKGKVWEWTTKYVHYYYDSDTDIFIAEWSPLEISSYLYGKVENGEIVTLECKEFETKDIQIRFTHIGYMEGVKTPSEFNIGELDYPVLNNKIVLSKYQKYSQYISFKDSLLPEGQVSNPMY